MKNIYKTLIAFIGVLLVSCDGDDVDTRTILAPVSTAEISAPSTGQNVVLDVDKAAEEAFKFTWAPAEYSNSVAVRYTLLIDKKGGDFNAAKILKTTTNSITEVSVLNRELNQAAIDLGGQPEVAADYDVKIASNVSGGFVQISEGLITMTITPYTGRVPYNFVDWYLVGDATVSGWDTNKGNQILFRSGTNANEYKFTGYFAAGAFKLISTPGQWAPSIGIGSGGTIQNRPTENDPDPSNFSIATAGYYTFTVNTTTNLYTLAPYTGPIATYTTVGIIGSSTAGAWNVSTPMIKSSFNPHIWTLGVTSLNDGEMKFRANDAWDVSWGAKTPFSGVNTGDNIPVSKSKYVIYFNDLDGSYLMIPNQ
ncbi:SusE domain-containing protein [Flavobacterium limi]|uniref:SusE outer membrane protein n=1 Tax=Flavobacterium limi TaxID=2045105 RepID=A0ABQ1TS04_9FLAO|nr:SusE domain-containing protein [Flavobacterium limi]GGF00139.1 hypothetical protein GCM10011518_06910 [Flavobacterium limi]